MTKKLQTKNIKPFAWYIMLIIILVLVILISLCTGQYSLSISQCISILLSKISPIFTVDWSGISNPAIAEKVVFSLRMPRVLAAALVGAALPIAGAAYQGVFQNPLVSPDILGVSSGACVGAALAILAGLGAIGIQSLAFVGGIVTVLLTLLIPRLLNNRSNIILVLSGVIMSGLMGSIMGFIKYVADPESELAAITYWQMGSFSYITYDELLSVLPALIFGFIGILLMSWRIDILSLGETEAKILGINVPIVRDFIILCATLLTASSVCISGTIGWVGLVIPHFSRMIVGPNNQVLLPTSALLGAIFMIIVDTIARTITTTEMPISIITGLLGAPFYVLLLYRQKTRIES